MTETSRLAREHEVAERLDVSIHQIRAGRQGKGALAKLRFVRFGRSIRYRESDLQQFIEARVVDTGPNNSHA